MQNRPSLCANLIWRVPGVPQNISSSVQLTAYSLEAKAREIHAVIDVEMIFPLVIPDLILLYAYLPGTQKRTKLSLT